MRIRSITYFCTLDWPLVAGQLETAGAFLSQAKAAFEAGGYEVQTTRLATPPFSRLPGLMRMDELPLLAEALEMGLRLTGIAYACLGPALPEVPESYAVIPEAVAASQNIFFSGIMAGEVFGLALKAVKACAEVIVRCASISPDGFANLRFAALANVPAGTPFFPAAYHDGGGPAFALATEAADLAVDAFGGQDGLEEGRRALVTAIEAHGHRLVEIAAGLPCHFRGIDFSLAPFPEQSRSLGAAFERMGVARIGLHGSLAAAALLTEAIERAEFSRAGFSGLFLPVLEDAILAQRAAEGMLTVKDLLLYSAVCGTGLDTIPLPGDVTSEQIFALLLDLATLALRLDKPLTARLLPIPGKKAGDPTGFDFAFFANSRVMALEAEEPKAALARGETLMIHPSGNRRVRF